MRCQFHQDTHRYYDDMCIAFHQDAYNTIENLTLHKLNRPILYEIEREDEEFASLTIGHIRHVQKHFHRSYRDWETDRKSTRLNSSHITRSRMPSSA